MVQKISRQAGFTFPEVLISLVLTAVLVSTLAQSMIVFAGWWRNGRNVINLQQNARVAMSSIINELSYNTMKIICPAPKEESDYLEIRNVGNSKTTKFYVAKPSGYDSAILYKYVIDDHAIMGGTVQLTEPSRICVSGLKFNRVGRNTVEMALIVKDIETGHEKKVSTMIQCSNAE